MSTNLQNYLQSKIETLELEIKLLREMLDARELSIAQKKVNATDSKELKTDSQGKFLRLNEVLKLIPVSKSTWWSGVKSGRFPPAIKLGPRITVWHFSDIQSLLEKN